ncbi:MAG: cellulase family glycosylhydrolase [Chthonomonadales bacterium]|nr:cellulase family glycosylhydrolase [Chthonomonadales bacterium]
MKLRMIAVFCLPLLPSGSPPPAAPLPRVGVRSGGFVRSGRAFRPSGFNYIRLRQAESDGNRFLWHDTLSPETYSGERASRMFGDIAGRGFNVVRIFLDPLSPAGFVDRAGAGELSPRYMANLLDFLSRARASGVYVILCFSYVPDRLAYRPGPPPENVEGLNQMYLHPGAYQARARYMADVCSAIRRHDASLLSTVFAYELENESHYAADQKPFSLTSGTVRWGGREYDAARPEDLQRLADDGIIAAANAARRAVRKVDPRALVSVSAFTFRAVGRSGPGRLRADRTPDTRFPVRPLAIARSRADYVDLHFYPMDERTIDDDYRSIEFDAVRSACRRSGKPMLVGEIGAFKRPYPEVAAAAAAMTSSLRRLEKDGFAGFLYWTYDNEEQSGDLWHARAGHGEIMAALETLIR